MTFEINGVSGYYDGKVADDSVRYGRNAVINHRELISSTLLNGLEDTAPILDLGHTVNAYDKNIQKVDTFVKLNDNHLKSLPPIEYQYRYMPEPKNGNIDKKALYGAAFEEMGTKAIPVEDFDKNFLPDKDYSVKTLDLNNDGKIDISEYSTSMLAADILSGDKPSVDSVNGVITLKGMNAVVEYSRISNAEAAVKLYSKIYDTYKLNELA